MKTIITTVLLTLFICALGYAQNEKTGDEVQTLFGSGAKVTGWFIEFSNAYTTLNRCTLSSSPYFIVEPGANIEHNVTGFMKLYAGYSYRWMMGLNLANTKSNALNGSNFNFGIRFGKL